MPDSNKPVDQSPATDRSEREQLVALINSIGDGFVSLDSSGKITHYNGAALSILDSNSLGGRLLSEVAHIIDNDGKPVDLQNLVLLSDSSFIGRDWLLRYADGSTINLQINFSPVHSTFNKKSERSFVLLFRDITREKAKEDERDEFISVASHELRTPIAIAEGSLSNAMLLAERGWVADPIKHGLAAAHSQIVFLSDLINDLAMLSRSNGSNVNQTIETFNPSELVKSLVEDYQALAKQKRLVLSANLAENLGLLTSSRLYVHEILQNFITNSIKYTDTGSVVVRAEQLKDGVEFSVVDTGFGISKPEQAKVFSKFFRSEDWRVRQNSGTGLGLYISTKLAGAIGGKLAMQSELNHGSTFKLYVPNLQRA